MSALDEERIERLERLNRESWEVLQTARQLHDKTAAALEAMFETARKGQRLNEAPHDEAR
jgi:hypothetical protein